jgi:beta-glucosidase-like glycosyl hydrolase
MGYRGLILSDDLLMSAVSRRGVVAAGLAALDAGCDGLLVLKNQSEALALYKALEKRLSESPDRVLPALSRIEGWWARFGASR